jgi:NTP pyrophosphatase (non-canonical NTP hydrolase)
MKNLIKKLIEFRDKRNWQDFHTPERLSMAVQIEAGELASLFQWGYEPDKYDVQGEIADVVIYCLYLCEKFDIDLEEAIKTKIDHNSIKYPSNVNHADVRGWNI